MNQKGTRPHRENPKLGEALPPREEMLLYLKYVHPFIKVFLKIYRYYYPPKTQSISSPFANRIPLNLIFIYTYFEYH